MTRKPPAPADTLQKIGTPSPSDQQSGAEMLASSRDFDMRIARDGTWFHRGTPIGRKPLVKLFSTVIRRDEAGDYWLVTPVERGRILVDDAPFTAVEFEISGSGRGHWPAQSRALLWSWGEPLCYADCDTSTGVGVCDVFDFLCFQDAFVGGCP